MPVTNIETFTNPRDSLPNVYNNVTAREIDFVTRFNDNWDALRNILGIMRPIRKTPGTVLKSYTASVALESGNVAAGNVIPYSKATITETLKGDVTIEKYAKAVTIEDVNTYGAEIAIEKSDDAFLTQLQNLVLGRFYTFLTTNSSALTDTATTWQMALAKAQGLVLNKFATMQKDVTEVVGFANILDAFDYLGNADITIQTEFGLTYIENFMGYKTLFLLPATQIPRNRVIALPVENIDLYYVDPADSEYAKLGLQYTTQGETNLIGFHVQGNYGTAVGETFAIMGMSLWAEYLDGIADVEIDDSFLADLTVAPDAADATYPWTDKTPSDFQSNVAVSGGKVTGELNFIEGGLAPSGPLAGDGYFLALKFDNFASGLTYANVQVGLVPSASGMGLVTLDSDKNAVFKITDKNNQKLKVVQSDNLGHKNIQLFGLDGLTLESVGA